MCLAFVIAHGGTDGCWGRPGAYCSQWVWRWLVPDPSHRWLLEHVSWLERTVRACMRVCVSLSLSACVDV